MSDEIKLANWGNFQHQLTAKNLDDMALDLLQIKGTILEEKDKISAVETKLELIDHLLSDSSEIKTAVVQAAEKIEKILEKIEELIMQNENLKKRVPQVSPMAPSLALKGYEKKNPSQP